SGDPLAAIKRLDAMDAGKMSKLWVGMSFDEKAQVRSNLRTLVTEVAMTAATEVLEQPVVGD
ncbi:MAG: hypothetical protein ACPGXX_22325, partial [Planctomycetaceae bacterium]